MSSMVSRWNGRRGNKVCGRSWGYGTVIGDHEVRVGGCVICVGEEIVDAWAPGVGFLQVAVVIDLGAHVDTVVHEPVRRAVGDTSHPPSQRVVGEGLGCGAVRGERSDLVLLVPGDVEVFLV